MKLNNKKGDNMYEKSEKQQQKELERFNKIAKLKSEAYSTKEIADILNISARTVNNTYKKYANKVPERLVEMGLDPKDIKHAWVKEDGLSAFMVNPLFESPQQMIDLTDKIVENIKKFSPKVPKIKRAKKKDPHMLEIDIADAHFGKLSVKTETGEEYNLEIAERRFKESVKELTERAVRAFNIDQINFIIGNDILHVDTPKRTTTSGTFQDTDGMWHEAFIKAKETYIWAIDYLKQLADVNVIYNPSNHDYMSGYYLAQVIDAYYSNDKNVKSFVDMIHRKYHKYGNNMIMYTHGDGAKEKDMSILMATESPKIWAETKYRYISGHHLHHHIGKEFIGATYKAKRSISSADRGHYTNGYVSLAGADAEVYSKTKGKVAEFIHYTE